MNKFKFFIFSMIVLLSIFALISFFNYEESQEVVIKNNYFKFKVKKTPSTIESFLPAKIDEDIILTYKVEFDGTKSKTIQNIPNTNEVFYLNVSSKKIPIPLIDKIDQEFIFNKYKIKECKLINYRANVFYFDLLRTEISIFCKSNDQKNTIFLELIENIGLVHVEAFSLNKITYKLDLIKIKDKNKEIFGDNLWTPDYD
jgi:hypothetical protein